MTVDAIHRHVEAMVTSPAMLIDPGENLALLRWKDIIKGGGKNASRSCVNVTSRD